MKTDNQMLIDQMNSQFSDYLVWLAIGIIAIFAIKALYKSLKAHYHLIKESKSQKSNNYE